MVKTILYADKLWGCGGIEAFEYYLAKYFKDNTNIEIELWYKECDPKQLELLNTVAKCVKFIGQDIICDNFLFPSRSCDDKLLQKVQAKNIIECFHMVQTHNWNTRTHQKVTKYLAVSKEAANVWTATTGKPCETFYPIIDLEIPERTRTDQTLRLISTGRLDDIGKGPDIMLKLANRLKERNINYEWVTYGMNNSMLTSDKFTYKGQLLDKEVLSQEIVNSDFFVQFTRAEGFGISIAEALNLNTPIITTPFSVLNEHNVDDGNCIVMNFDCSNIDEVIDKMLSNKFNFEYSPPTSNWEGLLNPPKVSIIIPVYNQENLIIKCIDSIPLRDDIEIIIVDDGSTDSTFNTLKNYNGKHEIKVIHFNKNFGAWHAVNAGLDVATGTYICRIDSDDYLYTDKFSKIIDDYVAQCKYNFITFNMDRNDGRIIKCSRISCGCSKFILRSWIGNKRFPNTQTAEDFWFWKEMLKDTSATYIDTNILAYHYNFPREGSLSDLRKKGVIHDSLNPTNNHISIT